MRMYKGSDLNTIKGVYYSEDAEQTGHVWMGHHDDDTGEFTFYMNSPVNIEEKDDVTLYTFSDGVVLVLHDNVLETEWEWKGETQPPSESYL